MTVPPLVRAVLEKLTDPQLIKQLVAFYRTRRFITVFTTARHLSLSWARLIQFTPFLFLEDTFWYYSFVYLSKVHVVYLSSRIPHKAQYAFLLSSVCVTCPAQITFFDLFTQYLVITATHQAPHCVVSSSFPLISSSKLKYLSNQPILKYPRVCSSVLLREAKFQAHIRHNKL